MWRVYARRELKELLEKGGHEVGKCQRSVARMRKILKSGHWICYLGGHWLSLWGWELISDKRKQLVRSCDCEFWGHFFFFAVFEHIWYFIKTEVKPLFIFVHECICICVSQRYGKIILCG